MIDTSTFLPSASRLGTIAQVIVYGFVTWLGHPGLWLAFPLPPLWIARLLAIASQESGYNPSNTTGDDGQSWGLYQFYAPTWASLTDRDPSDRLSVWWATWYAGKYVQTGLFASWRWWLVGVPGPLGFAVQRWMWTHGVSASSAGSLFTGDETYSSAWEAMVKGENRALPSYLFWTAIGAVASVPLLAAVLVARRRRRA